MKNVLDITPKEEGAIDMKTGKFVKGHMIMGETKGYYKRFGQMVNDIDEYNNNKRMESRRDVSVTEKGINKAKEESEKMAKLLTI